MIRLLQELDALPEPLPSRLSDILHKPVRNSRGEVVGEARMAVPRKSGSAVEAATV
jgi:hypothetical protein